MVVSNRLSPGFDWLTMHLTTKATRKSRETKDLVKTNVTFPVLLFPLPGTFFFYSTSRIQLKTHLLQNAFQTPPPLPGVELNSPFPTELKETHFYHSHYHILVLALWYLCLRLDDPKVESLRSHSWTITGKGWCRALQGDNASRVFIWVSWTDYVKSSLKIWLVSKLCRVRLLCSADQEEGSLLGTDPDKAVRSNVASNYTLSWGLCRRVLEVQVWELLMHWHHRTSRGRFTVEDTVLTGMGGACRKTLRHCFGDLLNVSSRGQKWDLAADLRSLGWREM